MFIVWGERKVTRSRGWVAEFCPICRGIQPFRVKDIRMVSHLYFIPLGSGQLVGQRTTCTGCRHTSFVEPFTYQSFIRDRNVDLDRLVAETNPGLLGRLTDRLVLEERTKQSLSALTPGERTALLTEPFLELSPQVEQRFGRETHIGTAPGLALLATISLAVAFLVAGPVAQDPGQSMPAAGVVLGVLSALSLVGTIYLFATQGSRHMRRRIVPLLARALAPLQPTRAELDDILRTLKAEGHRIGGKLNAEWILEAMRPAGTMAAHDRLAPRSDPLARP
jgi:hypothetical protein